ncbi:MAG: hypothetical protein QM627_10360 [Luteolibacter sp.]
MNLFIFEKSVPQDGLRNVLGEALVELEVVAVFFGDFEAAPDFLSVSRLNDLNDTSCISSFRDPDPEVGYGHILVVVGGNHIRQGGIDQSA